MAANFSNLFTLNQPSPTAASSAQRTFSAPAPAQKSPTVTKTSPAVTTGTQGTGGSQPAQGGQINTGGGQPQQPSGGGGPSLPNLDDLFAPIFNAYDQTQKAFEGNRDQSLTDVGDTYNQQQGLIPGYSAALTDTLNGTKTQFGQQVESALGQAARNFNAAKNAAMALYGGGNSASGAYTDLAQQEYNRQTGQIGNTQTQAEMNFGKETQDIGNWVAQKHSDLDGWLRDAKQQISQNFSTQLAALNNDRNASTQQKAAGKIQLLEDIMNQNNQLALADQNFRRQLALVQAQGQQLGQNNFDNSGFLNTLGQLGGSLGNLTNPANQSYAAATGNNSQPYSATPNIKDNQDYLSGLTNLLSS